MSAYIPIIFLFIILFMVLRTGKAVVARKVIQRRKKEDLTKMVELAERFIGKECLIYVFDSSHTFQGIVREVSDGAVLIENGGNLEAINLDFVIRIREYPRNKKGKKKAVVD